jgi:ankyrin repeat protein
VERLDQLHREFERLRSFQDTFKKPGPIYGIGAKLLYAVSLHGYYELVQMVLEKGADVNAQGGRHGNALQAASVNRREAVVALLLEKGPTSTRRVDSLAARCRQPQRTGARRSWRCCSRREHTAFSVIYNAPNLPAHH